MERPRETSFQTRLLRTHQPNMLEIRGDVP